MPYSIGKFLSAISFVFLCLSSSAEDVDLGDCSDKHISNSQNIGSISKNCIKDVFNKYKFSVVRVISITSQAADEASDADKKQQIMSGSGFFVSDRAYIMTSASLVHNANAIWVEHNGLTYSAECIGIDKSTNIAVIRIVQVPEKFDFVDIFSNTNENTLPSIGEFAVLVGCKFELDPSADFGIISGKNITYGDRVFVTTYLRSTLSFVGGESGSPVFDVDGELIGVMIAALPEMNSSFILPKRALGRIYNDIVSVGSVSYCAIGMEIYAEYKLSVGQQIIVSRVTPGSSANKCSLQSGDILLRMGNFEIKHREDVHNALFFARPGADMDISVMRDDSILNLKCTIDPSAVK